jgi:hypothetical protein
MENEKSNAYIEMVEGYCDTVYEEGLEISELPETFLWKKPIENMISSLHYDHLKLPRYQGLLLFGENGNGKHTIAEAYIQSVCKSEMCFEKAVYIRLRAEDFNAKQLTSLEDITSFVAALFEICAMSGEQSFIVFDQMEKYDEITVVCNCIADALLSVTEKIHVICISEDFKLIPAELSKILLKCKCSAPDEILRKKYFEDNLSFNVEDWIYGSDYMRTIKLEINDISTDELVKLTDGFSFAMLGEFVQILKMDISGRTLGDEPVCSISIGKAEAMSYIHMLGSDISVRQTAPQVVYVNSPISEVNAVKNDENDIEIKNLINKGGARSVEENLQLIDAVPVLKE